MAQNGPRVREFLTRQRPKKTVKLMRTARKEPSKTCSSYEKKPATIKKNPKRKETASKTGRNEKSIPQGKQGKGSNVDSTCKGITVHWKTNR